MVPWTQVGAPLELIRSTFENRRIRNKRRMRDPRLVSPFVLVLWKKGKSIRSSSIVDESRKFTMSGYFSHLPWTRARERRYTRLRKDKVNRDGRNLSVICSRLIGINRARQYVQWMEERITRIVICRVIFFFLFLSFFFLSLTSCISYRTELDLN